ncbi:hypothetical protein BJX76DRAFT_344556 [Aspergillus varians]
MLKTLIHLLFFLAVSVVATGTLESSVLNRLLQLDLGLRTTYILLDRIDEASANVTASDVIVAYNAIVAPGTNTIQQPFASSCDEATQFTLCQAYHTFAITSISLYTELTDNAPEFSKDLRNGLQEGFNRIYNENAYFVDNVASGGLPLCLESIQWDCWALTKAYLMACKALSPSAV